MTQHPAKYSDSLLSVIKGWIPEGSIVLDPFAGTGKLRDVYPSAILLEIEPEWAALRGAQVGDATKMPFSEGRIDVICTSPTYGNRMADSFRESRPSKGYKRYTYTHCLGRKLSPNNSGGMQWGSAYRALHSKAWEESYRVLRKGGRFILNISNHIRKGKEVDVTKWHVGELTERGFHKQSERRIATPRQKHGANRHLRVRYESLILFIK